MSEDRLRPHGAEPSGLPEADALALVGGAPPTVCGRPRGPTRSATFGNVVV